MKVPYALASTLTLTSWTETGPASEWSGQGNLHAKELELAEDLESYHLEGGGLSQFDTKIWNPSLWERKKCWFGKSAAYLSLVGIKCSTSGKFFKIYIFFSIFFSCNITFYNNKIVYFQSDVKTVLESGCQSYCGRL